MDFRVQFDDIHGNLREGWYLLMHKVKCQRIQLFAQADGLITWPSLENSETKQRNEPCREKTCLSGFKTCSDINLG